MPAVTIPAAGDAGDRHRRGVVDERPDAELAEVVPTPGPDPSAGTEGHRVVAAGGDRGHTGQPRYQAPRSATTAAARPSWPTWPSPHERTVPSRPTARLCPRPAATEATPVSPATTTGADRSTVGAVAQLAPEFQPQAHTVRPPGPTARLW